jgi:hypothetical protein
MQPYKPRRQGRQDSRERYSVTDQLRQSGNIQGKHEVRIPELKMSVFIDDPAKADQIREMYLNRKHHLEL